MTKELYKRFRPKSFKSVVGQSQAVKFLESKLKTGEVPHSILMSGPSGCGKTSIARILANELGAQMNFVEMDVARNNGIDAIRRLEQSARLSPLGGGVKVYLLDESHSLTSAASNAALKILEDTPSHVYFILATTNPGKLIPTIRNRCTHLALKAVGKRDLTTLINRVCKRIKLELKEEVLDSLIESAEGSPRRALVLLDVVRECEDVESQLNAIRDEDTQREAIEICRILFRAGGGKNWAELCTILKSVEEEPESLRRMILGYARSCLLKPGRIAGKAAAVIESFQDNYYDSGAAGLALSCYQVLHGE